MKYFVGLSVSFLLLHPIPANADDPSFWGIYKYVSEFDHRAICIADFNGDGVDDFALAKGYSGIGVVLSNGDGTFASQISHTALGEVQAVCSGDFDDDGDADLAAMVIGLEYEGEKSADFVAVYINAGNGTFSLQTWLMLGLSDSPSGGCTPDLDGDGDADLVVALQTVNKVYIFISAGNGSFSAGTSPAVGTSPASVWPADFNGDGDADIAVANFGSANVSVLLGGGDGTMAPAVNFVVGSNPRSVCAEDFNEDGNDDLAVANLSSSNVSVLLGNGNGGFGGPNNYAVGSPQSICSADIDDDGHPDLAVANTATYAVCTLLGNGDGTFDPANCVLGGDVPVSIVAGDLDNDGSVDLATPNTGASNSVSIYFNTGNGTFPMPPRIPAGDSPGNIVSADFDGDGDLDVAETNRYSDNLSIHLNSGNGSFSLPVSYAAGDEPLGLCSGDFDFDGDPDLAVSNYISHTSPGTVSVLLNQGNGTFGPRTPYTVLVSPQPVCAADMDGDNVDDIVVGNLRSNNVSYLRGVGNGTLQLMAHYAVNGPANGGPQALVTTDLDSDGDKDIAAGNWWSGGVSILKNAGNGTFSAAVNYATDLSPYDMCSGDFDDDGDTDIAFVTTFATIHILMNSGNGSFNNPVQYNANFGNTSICSADLDGDSDLDLAIGNLQNDETLMLVNNGTGAFGKVKYGLCSGYGNGPRGITTGDLDGDGDIDLVTTNSTDILVLRNLQVSPVTAVDPLKVVTRGQLYQNMPNPFNPTTTIRYDIAERSLVTLKIYNVAGQQVRTLVSEVQAPRAGGFAVSWNGRNEAGQLTASGVYFYKLTAGPYSQVRKMVLLK